MGYRSDIISAGSKLVSILEVIVQTSSSNGSYEGHEGFESHEGHSGHEGHESQERHESPEGNESRNEEEVLDGAEPGGQDGIYKKQSKAPNKCDLIFTRTPALFD